MDGRLSVQRMHAKRVAADQLARTFALPCPLCCASCALLLRLSRLSCHALLCTAHAVLRCAMLFSPVGVIWLGVISLRAEPRPAAGKGAAAVHYVLPSGAERAAWHGRQSAACTFWPSRSNRSKMGPHQVIGQPEQHHVFYKQ